MDFEFTDDQVSLRDAVAKWVEKGFDFSRRHGIAKAGGKTRDVYAELAELGLTGLAIPEAHGGMGFGAVEAMVVMEELGRGLVNAPYAAAALVVPTLLSAAPDAVKAAWLPKIADASALVVPAIQERSARYQLNHVTTTATQGANGWTLSGQKHVVPAADEADAFVLPARISGAADSAAGIGLFLVEKGAMHAGCHIPLARSFQRHWPRRASQPGHAGRPSPSLSTQDGCRRRSRSCTRT